MAKVQAIPAGCDRIVPYLCIKGAAEAIKYYEKAFGAKETMRMPGPDGKSIGHAEIKIGDSLVFISDEFSHGSSRSPASLKGTTVAMMFYVNDVDKVFNQAIAAGGKAIMPPTNMFWGDRFCKLADPFGHEWALCTHIEDVSHEEMMRRGQESMKKMGQPQ